MSKLLSMVRKFPSFHLFPCTLSAPVGGGSESVAILVTEKLTMREMRHPIILALVFLVLGVLWMPGNVTGQESALWNPDANGDGCVTTSDLVSLLSVFGLCSEWGSVDCPDSLEFTCFDAVDFDNYGYQTVLIGSQCWFAENLRTTVYANGELIPAGLTVDEWSLTMAGAMAVYGEGSSDCQSWSPDIDACDEEQSLAEYGRLYNWYAVDDARGLCPIGWHVPTDEEWTELENYISSEGFDGMEGVALKSTYGWTAIFGGGNGTDDFGFSALPGGSRGNLGDFLYAGDFGHWWSSTSNDDSAWGRFLFNILPIIQRSYYDPHDGFSIRCLKD